MSIILLNQLQEEIEVPKKIHIGDAATDVVASSVTITPDYIEYGLGFSSDIPEGYKGVIVPRSSISKYNLIMCNSPAQIDQTYKDEWKVRFKYFGKKTLPIDNFNDPEVLSILSNDFKIYKIGDRIAQIFFEKVEDTKIVFKDKYGNTHMHIPKRKRSKGSEGFGSSGT